MRKMAIRGLGVGVLLLSLTGCATNNPRDPLEPYNRAMFQFNDTVDKALIKPVAQGYESVVPRPVRLGVNNFFSNLGDVWIGVNNLLQGKFANAINDFGRVAINTTLGFYGVLDIASEAGLEKHQEDFGQTLAKWGVGSGPYVVLPFFGSSTVRDTVGKVVADNRADGVTQTDHVPTRNSAFALRTIDTRSEYLNASSVLDEAALDPYTFARDAWLKRRLNQIYDGNPPVEDPAADEVPVSETTADITPTSVKETP